MSVWPAFTFLWPLGRACTLSLKKNHQFQGQVLPRWPSSKAFATSAGYCGSFTTRAGYVWIVRHQSGICVDRSPPERDMCGSFATRAGYVWIVRHQSGICVDRSPAERDMCGSFATRAGYVWIVRHQSGLSVDCSPLFMFEAYQ